MDAVSPLRGVAAMLLFRPEWRRHFDVSPRAYIRSFLVALPAAPLFALALLGQNHAYAALAQPDAEIALPGSLQGGILFVCLWLYLPAIARVFTRVFQIEGSYRPWIIVHNWTVLLLLIVQGALGGLLLAGVVTPTVYLNLASAYFATALFAHCRVAAASLDAPLPLAIGGATLGILAWLLIQVAFAMLFAGLVLQA